MMNRVGTKSDIGSKGVTHKIQARSGDSRSCLLRCCGGGGGGGGD